MHLTQQMSYVLPAQIGAQVRGIAAQRKEDKLIAVDLGCGTGLCGAEIVASVSHLAGVDASPAMLDQADRRGIYHDLVEGDIEHYLAGLADASVDILAAGDALPFFGLLDNIFRAAARVLRPEGAFVFSIETLEGTADYQLHHSGRFRHSVQYIEKLAAGSGLLSNRAEVVELRVELGRPVPGRLFVLRKRSGRGLIDDIA